MGSEERMSSIEVLFDEGEEATAFNAVTQEILQEEASKLRGIPKQADNWNALANQVVGASFINLK
jgi:hypothetical protein